MAIKLSENFVRDQVPPPKGAITIWDDPGQRKAHDGVRGFGLRIHAGGAKSFFLNYRLNGVERRYTIGPWPEWSVAAALERAKEKRRLVDDGIDPTQDRREQRDAPTVQNLVDRYVRDHLPKKTGGEQRAKDEQKMLDLIADKLGKHTKVAEVHFGDIEAMHRSLTEARGPIRANRILSLASKMFSLSLRPLPGENLPWRNAVMGNPCKGVAKNPESGRERFYSAAELATIGDVLSDYGDEARGPGVASAKAAADCVRLIMLTGCRPTEARLATWEQFDAEPGFWIKPSAHTKQRKVHKLPLNPPTLELIGRLRKERRKGAKWIFAGQRPGEPLKQLHSVWSYIRDKAKLGPDSRLYDLRHSFASIGAGRNLGLPVIGRLLGHTQARTTQRYAHLADDPLREATKKIGSIIRPPTGDEPSADIVPIAKAR